MYCASIDSRKPMKDMPVAPMSPKCALRRTAARLAFQNMHRTVGNTRSHEKDARCCGCISGSGNAGTVAPQDVREAEGPIRFPPQNTSECTRPLGTSMIHLIREHRIRMLKRIRCYRRTRRRRPVQRKRLLSNMHIAVGAVEPLRPCHGRLVLTLIEPLCSERIRTRTLTRLLRKTATRQGSSCRRAEGASRDAENTEGPSFKSARER